ncbi:hypothetical protein [Methylocapsa palsarum]|uniref:Uncharacterized protein n=1 Tax=Methylocapsa palsarum TaxID=1612308 RepID=A0A1I3ZIW0_9HYPH|nr:hypothetical protein [Methylocapsa palsarum]SFK44014.1 hypothetical protein SAMN05444581_10813 [Methylocapsa palsarum]
MRADFALVLASVLAGPAFAQMASGAPGGSETIPEKKPPAGLGQFDGRSSSQGAFKPAPGIDPEIVKPARERFPIA